jgi:lipopolysaccharide transport system permease protein
MIYFQVPFTAELLLWPVLLLPLVMFTTAVGMLFAALNVKFRDIKYTIPFFMQAMLFLSPVAYPVSAIPERWSFVHYLNPLAGILDAFRAAVLPSRTIAWGDLGIAVGATCVLVVIASVYFYRTERTFADLI